MPIIQSNDAPVKDARTLSASTVHLGDTSLYHWRTSLKWQSEETLRMASLYIETGIVIVKTHAPIFSESGRVGCTCEAYKRSDKYRQWCKDNGKTFVPNYTCPNPGKHPAGNWKNETDGATINQVHDIWGRFHTATDVDTGKRVQVVWNIGTLTGPSNLLTLDADTYKAYYQCDLSDLVDLDDQETPTAVTHSGGAHLVFDRQGKPYTNANGELKAAGIDGVDVRGVGGFQVLAPSRGPSGNFYSWAEGLEPWTVKPRPIPPALDALLSSSAAKRNKASTPAVTFTTPTTERPTLSQWHISKKILDLIHNPRPKGQRSGADYSVCLSLVYAGAGDDDILSVFEHYPIGAAGKFAEAGRAYLGHTIANARAHATDHPRPNVSAMIDQYRRLAEFGDWARIIPVDRQSANGYLTGQTDRRLFLNLLDILERTGRVEEVTVSYRQLTTRTDSNGVSVAIGSLTTAKKFLDRVNGVLLTYTTTDRSTVVSLVPVVSRSDTSQQSSSMTEVSDLLTTGSVVSPHLADDAFAIGTARWAREVIDAEKRVLMADNPPYQEATIAYKAALASKPADMAEMARLIGADTLATYRELCERAAADFLPGLGMFGLLVIADLLDNPRSDKQSIADRRGLKLSSVATVLRKLDAWGLVETEQAFGGRKLYTLVGDVFGEIAERLPEARTYRIGVQRLDRQLESAKYWAEKEAADAEREGDEERQQLAAARVTRLANRRMATAAALHPELTGEELLRWVFSPVYIETPKSMEAPAMPAPGDLAWQRWLSLGNKAAQNSGLLDADNYGEFAELTKVLPGAAAYVGRVAWNGVIA
jgi:hypothetical protein